jgi:hypothetical protein
VYVFYFGFIFIILFFVIIIFVSFLEYALYLNAAYLNRQIVVLLSNLGIPGMAFERLQDEMVKQLEAMLHNNDAAKLMLKSMPDQHDFSTTALKMLKVSYKKKKELFLDYSTNANCIQNVLIVS